MKALRLVTLSLVLSQGALAHGGLDQKREWPGISDPLIFKVAERRFEALPLVGKVANPVRYWSSDYWSKSRGGINYRWNATRAIGFNLKSPSKEQALAMTQDALAQLAPTEKLDLLAGSYDYPLKREISRYADPDAPDWEGICNGWSEAALHHDEPVPVTVINPDGISIPFGSSDIKALLSWYYFRKSATDFNQIGRRCWDKSDSCNNDVNAGAFHLILSNVVGAQGGSFIADIDRGSEVWNHLAYDYTTEVLYDNLRPQRSSAYGTVKLIRVQTTVNYIYELSKNSWYPVLGTEAQKFTKKTYEYYLDVDATGAIIGGEWISKQRPDFLWTSSGATEFTGNMAALGKLVSPGN